MAEYLLKTAHYAKLCICFAILFRLSFVVFYQEDISSRVIQQQHQHQQQQQRPLHDAPPPSQSKSKSNSGMDEGSGLYTPTVGLEHAPRLRPEKGGQARIGAAVATTKDTVAPSAPNDSDVRPTNNIVDDNVRRPSNHTAGKKAAANTTTTTTPSNPEEPAALQVWIRKKCFPQNSDKWINGTKFSNNDEGVTPELLQTLLKGPRKLESLPAVLDQTICHKDSPLRTFGGFENERDNTNHETSSLAFTEDWYQRFLYLAFHWRFHRPALAEYKSRRACLARDEATADSIGDDADDAMSSYTFFRKEHGIGHLDFECPGSKFLVIPVGSIGLGAYINTQASLGLLVALQTGRIPVFSSRSHFEWQTKKGETDPWLLAPSSCSRKDLQCYFLPVSPCTVTEEDLESATLFGATRKEQMSIKKTHWTLPPELDDKKVVVFNPGLQTKALVSDELPKVAAAVVRELLEEYSKGSGGGEASHPQRQLLEQAHRWITEKAKADPFGLIKHAAIYLLRPNPRYKAILEDKMAALVSSSIDPSDTIGIAIRGSDKCLKESTCFSFEKYMDLVTEVGYPNLLAATGATPFYNNNNTSSSAANRHHRPNLILTTEDPKVFNDSLAYQNNASFPFRFLVNADDNMQGSGFPKDFSPLSPRGRFRNQNKNVSSDADNDESEKTIVSSLVVLKFHFYASKVYLNCCSNFHSLLDKLIGAQCGVRRHGNQFVYGGGSDTTYNTNATTAAPPPVSVCLSSQGTPPKYRLCCQGHKYDKGDTECKEIWSDYEKERKDKE